jgi:hypothetical protein
MLRKTCLLKRGTERMIERIQVMEGDEEDVNKLLDDLYETLEIERKPAVLSFDSYGVQKSKHFFSWCNRPTRT